MHWFVTQFQIDPSRKDEDVMTEINKLKFEQGHKSLAVGYMTVLSELLLLLGKLTHVTRTTPEFKFEQLYKLADTIKINKNAMTSKRSVQLKKFLAEKKLSGNEESMTDFEIVYDEICRWGKEDELIIKDLELDEKNTPSPIGKRQKSESPKRNLDRQGKFRRVTAHGADVQNCCACCGTETCAGSDDVMKCSLLFKLAYENSQRIAFDFKALKAMNEQNRRTAVEMAKQKGYMRSWDEDKTNNFWATYENFANRTQGGQGEGRGSYQNRSGRDGGRGHYGGGYKPYANSAIGNDKQIEDKAPIAASA